MRNRLVGLRGFFLLSLALFLLPYLQQSFADDVVTLNTEEILRGRIVDTTDTNISIVVGNYNGTIFVTKVIAKSDIKTIEKETPEQKKEQADYSALSTYRLNPNQELTEAQYNSGIAAFNKFLTDHPQSHFTNDINTLITTWSTELSNLQSGKVKFENKWMTPDEKQPQAEKSQKQNAVESTQHSIQSLQIQLANLQSQRRTSAENLTIAEGQLANAKATLASLQDASQPVYQENGGGGRWGQNANGIKYWIPYATSQTQMRDNNGNPIFQTIPNPDRPADQSRVASLAAAVSSGTTSLAALDSRIKDTQLQLAKLGQDYNLAVARANAPPLPKPIVEAKAEPPPPPPPTPPPAPPPPTPEQPWYVLYWKWIAGGVSLAVVLFVVSRSRAN
jgi:hypothetical protein